MQASALTALAFSVCVSISRTVEPHDVSVGIVDDREPRLPRRVAGSQVPVVPRSNQGLVGRVDGLAGRQLEVDGDYTARLALLEELKGMPFGAVWDYHCHQQSVPVGFNFMPEIKAYEKDVLSKR